tara:strand:+ start:1035 stop:1355 length:321 start_codon:yes stop_codon:yes gene_type:complete
MDLELIFGDGDPLAGEDEFDIAVQKEDLTKKIEYESPGGRYKLETNPLSATDFGHVIWDYMAEGDGDMQPFLARENAIWISHGTDSYESAIRWHEKAIRFLYRIDP